MRRSSLALIVVAILCSVGSVWAQQTWDLSADWSEASNPNGQWTYADENLAAYPNLVQNFNTPDMGPGQTGWSGIGEAHRGWAKSIGAGTLDFPAGAVGAHGACRIVWTCLWSDTYTISGGCWMFRHIGRSVTWHIWKKSGDTLTDLTSSTQNDSTTQFNSTTPEPFSNGSGGAGVLTQTLVAGEQLIFGHDDPDFFAYSIGIAAQTKVLWNLSQDWAEVTNPNGEWTYANGSQQVFPTVVQNFNTPDMGPGQTGWDGLGPAHEGWAKSIGAGPHDFPAGAVGSHGPTRVIWTCPRNGNYVIGGGGWMFRHIGRTVTWHLWKNDVELSQGTQNDGTPQYNSTTPEEWSNGSGGAAVLAQSLTAGDKIMFGHDDGDFFAYSIVIAVEGVPIVPTSTPTITPTPTVTPTPKPKHEWDFAGDWSEENGNPNDVWTYTDQFLNPFPAVVQDFLPGDMGPGATAWGDGTHLGWSRATGLSPHDFPAGRIMAHGPARLKWTAPKAATYIISGGGWMLRHQGRAVRWVIIVNGVEVSAGQQDDTTIQWNSASPQPWQTGSGGAEALTQTLAAGDTIVFGHNAVGTPDDFFAYEIHIFIKDDPLVNPTPTPTISTITPTPTINSFNAEVYKLDSQPYTEYLGIGVGDVNGDSVADVVSTVKGGAAGVFNDTNVFFLNGIDLETITDPFNEIPNENVYTAGMDEGAWFAATGDFLGNGRHQILLNHRADGRASSAQFAFFGRNNTDPPGTNSAWSLLAGLPVEFGSAGSYSQTGRFFPGVNRDFITIGSGLIDSYSPRLVGLDDTGTAICSNTYGGPATGADNNARNKYRATFLGDVTNDGQPDIGYWKQSPKMIAFTSYASGSCGSLVTTVSQTLWVEGQAPFDGVQLPTTSPELGKEFDPCGKEAKFFVGDPSKDGKKEILMGLSKETAPVTGYVISMQAKSAGPPGSIAFDFEVIDIFPGQRFVAVTSADLDGDGDEEVIAGTRTGYVFGYVRRDQAPPYDAGNLVPAGIGNHYLRFGISGDGEGNTVAIGAPIADIGVGDVDGDGQKEVAVSCGYPGGGADTPGTYVIDKITVPPAPALPTSITDWVNY